MQKDISKLYSRLLGNQNHKSGTENSNAYSKFYWYLILAYSLHTVELSGKDTSQMFLRDMLAFWDTGGMEEVGF